MTADIEFYLAGGVGERMHQLTAPDAPLVLERKILNFYRLTAKNPVLDNFFICGTPDIEADSENPLHIEVQRALGFHPGTNLHYGRCNLNNEKIAAFKELVGYISANGIPFYMTVIDEAGDEELVVGNNPATNAEIKNSKLGKGLTGLLG